MKLLTPPFGCEEGLQMSSRLLHDYIIKVINDNKMDYSITWETVNWYNTRFLVTNNQKVTYNLTSIDNIKIVCKEFQNGFSDT